MPEDNATPAAPAEDEARKYDSLSESQLRELLISAHKQVYSLQAANQSLWYTLRDQFSAAVLPAVVASALAEGLTWRRTPHEISLAVTLIVDAMMAERAKGGDQ